jgi:hypothetical protein
MVDVLFLLALLAWGFRARGLRPRFSLRGIFLGLLLLSAYLAVWHREQRLRHEAPPHWDHALAELGPCYAPWERLLRVDLLPGKGERVCGIHHEWYTYNAEDHVSRLSDLSGLSANDSVRFFTWNDYPHPCKWIRSARSDASVHLDRPLDVTDLGRLSDLEHLELINLRLRTAECEPLKLLRKLRVLRLPGTQIDDGAADLILHLPWLTSIDLRDTEVGDAVAQASLTRSRLVALNLMNTRVTDEGLRDLSDTVPIQRMQLEQTQVTRTALERLRLCPDLMHLNIARTRIHARDLQILAAYPRLEWLVLDDSQLSMESYAVLNSLPQLRRLTIVRPAPAPSMLEGLRNPSIRNVDFFVPVEHGEFNQGDTNSLIDTFWNGYLQEQPECMVAVYWWDGAYLHDEGLGNNLLNPDEAIPPKVEWTVGMP